MPWGYHYSLDCQDCDLASITSKEHIEKFTKELVEKIEMVAYGDPMIVHFGEGDKEGYTLVQLIETSNICAHFVNESKSIYLDVFSCKEFDSDLVADIVLEYFSPKMFKERFFERE